MSSAGHNREGVCGALLGSLRASSAENSASFEVDSRVSMSLCRGPGLVAGSEPGRCQLQPWELCFGHLDMTASAGGLGLPK